MRFLARTFWGLVALALTVALLLLAVQIVQAALAERAKRAEQAIPIRERVFAARVVRVEPGAHAPQFASYGEVRARRSVDLRAPLAGRVIWVAPELASGVPVEEGQVLLKLDPTEAEAALALARTDLARAEIDLRDAERLVALTARDRAEAEAQVALRERALARRQELIARGVGSDAQVEEAELALAAARAQAIARASAEAQAQTRLELAAAQRTRAALAVAEAERRLAETVITAPFAGVVAELAVSAGAIISPNERLLQLIDPDALEIAFRLSTAQFLRLIDDEGALLPLVGEAVLEVGGVMISSPIRLARVAPQVGEAQSGRLLFAELLAPRGFRPGDFVSVRVTEPLLPDVAVLPAAAVDAAGHVLVVGPEERLFSATVEIVRREQDRVLVRAPDLAGREIVALRTPVLGEGIRIRPQRADAAPAPAAEPEMVSLDPERRAALIARVSGNTFIPEPVRARILAELQQDRVPRRLVERLESGGPGG